MFMEPTTSKGSSSLQRSEMNLQTIAGNIALLRSAGRSHNRFNKHLAPLEPEHCLVAAQPALSNLRIVSYFLPMQYKCWAVRMKI